MINYNLVGKNALISGGTHGIGKEIAIQLAKEGCNIYFFSRDIKRVYDTYNELKKINAKVKGYVCDVLKLNDISVVLNSLKREEIEIDILINNVGGGGRWGMSFINTSTDVWNDVYQKNLGAAVELTKQLLPDMIQHRWGRVITISSIIGKNVSAGDKPWFASVKAAEIAFMKCLSKESFYVTKNITFNTVCPGSTYIKDTGWDNMLDEEMNIYLSCLPLKRMMMVEEVANVVSFLCSDKASGINGSCITVDGGESNYL